MILKNNSNNNGNNDNNVLKLYRHKQYTLFTAITHKNTDKPLKSTYFLTVY